MDKKKIKMIISWIIVLIWMIVIFVLSNTPATESTKDSKKVIQETIVTTTTVTNDIGLTDYHPTEKELKQVVKQLNGPLREFMHAFEYFILAILLLIALNNSNVKKKYQYTFIICLIYIFTDELHQTFISGRTFQFLDIFLDSVGTSGGAVLYRLIKRN